MLKRLKLVSFKGFRNFSISFGTGALLVGPNNAGKSTIVSAIRLANAAAKISMRRRPTDNYQDQDRRVSGFPLSMIPDYGFNFENIRHEFEVQQSRVELEYSSGAKVHVVWPVEETAFFWVEHSGSPINTAAKAKTLLERVGMVPTLTPLEREEKTLSGHYLQQNVDTKLASRHFRNNLQSNRIENRNTYDELISFLLDNTVELAELSLVESHKDGAAWLDLYYRDTAGRTEKEIFWAGDGLQIWLQILFHLWRNKDCSTIILDEPDVFLHPDLQRRLVRVLEANSQQIIMSSHSSEVAGESSEGNIVWIERSQRFAKRLKDESQLQAISGALGSAFNLSIAKALKSKVALFVEGEDMKILRLIAARIDCPNLVAETRLAVVGIGGFSHWPSVEAFSWIKEQFLGDSVKVHLILDKDYRTIEEAEKLEESMERAGVLAHVWRKKELESYLLEPAIVALAAGVSESVAADTLLGIADEFKSQVAGQYSKSALDSRDPHIDVATALAQASSDFENLWSNHDNRLAAVPAKSVISTWNRDLGRHGGKPISSRKLAAKASVDSLNWEMTQELKSIEDELSRP